jgi:hypothetical protein
VPLDQVEVSIAPDAPPALLADRGNLSDAGQWVLLDLNVGSGYAAALALAGMLRRLVFWQWPAPDE